MQTPLTPPPKVELPKSFVLASEFAKENLTIHPPEAKEFGTTKFLSSNITYQYPNGTNTSLLIKLTLTLKYGFGFPPGVNRAENLPSASISFSDHPAMKGIFEGIHGMCISKTVEHRDKLPPKIQPKFSTIELAQAQFPSAWDTTKSGIPTKYVKLAGYNAKIEATGTYLDIDPQTQMKKVVPLPNWDILFNTGIKVDAYLKLRRIFIGNVISIQYTFSHIHLLSFQGDEEMSPARDAAIEYANANPAAAAAACQMIRGGRAEAFPTRAAPRSPPRQHATEDPWNKRQNDENDENAEGDAEMTPSQQPHHAGADASASASAAEILPTESVVFPITDAPAVAAEPPPSAGAGAPAAPAARRVIRRPGNPAVPASRTD